MRLDQRRIDRAQLARLPDMPSLVGVLVREQPHESAVFAQVIERHADQIAHRPDRIEPLEVEFRIMGPRGLIGPFQHLQIEFSLRAEVVKQHLLAHPGALADCLDAGAVEAQFGEFAIRRVQKIAARALRIAHAVGRLAFAGRRDDVNFRSPALRFHRQIHCSVVIGIPASLPRNRDNIQNSKSSAAARWLHAASTPRRTDDRRMHNNNAAPPMNQPTD